MKNRFLTVILLLVLLVSLTGNAQAISQGTEDQPALVYVEINSSDDLTRFAITDLPIYTRLTTGLLSGASASSLQAIQEAGLRYQVLDEVLGSGAYYLASAYPSRPAPHYALYGQVLLTTPDGVLLRMEPSRAESLARAGAELRAIDLTPKPFPYARSQAVFPKQVEPDPIVQGMINQVTETQVYTYDKQLAGALPVYVDGDWYTITTRNTNSVTPIQKTTHFVGQHMQDLGMSVDYHVWSNNTNPDVIGEITGQTRPDDIFMIGAHIDDVNGTPGADDNASGSVGTLLAADILSHYQWDCTLRFAFWTGEEQGLLGSDAYAQEAANLNENILGYLNLDMIAWNTLYSSPDIYLTYDPSLPLTLDLANLFADVVSAYNLDLIPEIGTMYGGSSDQYSFWTYGYTSILGIESPWDFNPYYHGPSDTPAHTNPAYFTEYIKAAIATYAHMTGCLIPTESGALDGHVTSAVDGLPIAGAAVTAEDAHGQGYPNFALTDATGYYTHTLPVDTYTVTVTADGYEPGVESGVQIITDTTTTRDFVLQLGCQSVGGLDFNWVPAEPFNGDVVTFTATAGGTPPIDYLWDFADTQTAVGETVTHTYAVPGIYPVTVTATNPCSSGSVVHPVSVLGSGYELFLPLVTK